MGLIKAAVGAAGGVLADQWREYFYSDSLKPEILAVKGKKRISSRSSNTDGENNIITNGSGIAVNDGQCMIIVEQGNIVDLCAVPGVYTYDISSEPSIFDGDLNHDIKAVFKRMRWRFTYGGDTGNDQRVYYFNTKEIVGNKYGTANAIPFRIVDKTIGLDIDSAIKCYGEYSYRITNPLLFYKNVCGNVEDVYNRNQIDGQLKTELLTAMQTAFAELSQSGIRYSLLPNCTHELARKLNSLLSAKWSDLRGIEIVSFGISSLKASSEDEQMIKELQRNAAFKNPIMAAAQLVGSQAAAMKDAANNQSGMGAAVGFMGMNMVHASGEINATNLFAMGKKENQYNGWTCSCGQTGNTGKFCENCGKIHRDSQADDRVWKCSVCGTENTGKFCKECGAKKTSQRSSR